MEVVMVLIVFTVSPLMVSPTNRCRLQHMDDPGRSGVPTDRVATLPQVGIASNSELGLDAAGMAQAAEAARRGYCAGNVVGGSPS
jgi:hypothetical protein